MILWLCFLTVASASPIPDEVLSNLKLVTIITRHGDRTPITLYPNDPNVDYKYKEGVGQLTNLGKYQHYKIGEYLRERYASYITSHPTEISVKSSAKPRTIASALVNLAAFYRPEGDQVFKEGLDWQPVPVFSSNPKEDGLLYEGAICPEAKAEQERIRNSPEGEAYRSHYTELFELVTNHSGMTVDDWETAADIFSTLKIEKRHDLIIPDWITDEVYEKLRNITDDSFYWSYKTPKIQRLRGGMVIGETVEHMLQKSRGELVDMKVYFYSTHDVNIAAVLNALGVFNNRAPPFAATIIIELHEVPEATHFVRVFYSNSSTPETGEQHVHLLTLPGCEADCPLNTFVEITELIIPKDWKAECKLQHEFPETSQPPECGNSTCNALTNN